VAYDGEIRQHKTVPGFEDLVALRAGKNDPSNAFGYLQGAEQAEEAGAETVNGVETTHFRVTVDLADALDDVPGDLRSELRLAIQQFEAQFGTTTMPFDAWWTTMGCYVGCSTGSRATRKVPGRSRWR